MQPAPIDWEEEEEPEDLMAAFDAAAESCAAEMKQLYLEEEVGSTLKYRSPSSSLPLQQLRCSSNLVVRRRCSGGCRSGRSWDMGRLC